MSETSHHEPEDLDPTAADGSEDFEEISSDEVDRVVEALEGLMATVESENIRYFLEEATDSIYLLIYGDDEQGRESEAA